MAAARFSELSKMKYYDQAIWFLNGFWEEGLREEANTVWDFIQYFIELDKQQMPPKGIDGNELDQFWSARFLEVKDSAMPALKRKEALKKIDVDSNGKMSAIEYFVWKYDKSVEETISAPQGDNKAAIEAAKAKMDEVQSALADVAKKIRENEDKIAEVEDAKRANIEAIEAVKVAQAAVLKAEEELQAAQAELKQQEDSYNGKIADLEKKSQEGSMVQRSKAANELAQMKAEDPLPLRKAKIANEAALRKVAKETKEAHQKIADGEAKAKELQAFQEELEQAKEKLNEAQAELGLKMEEAERELEVAKTKGEGGKGALYWMNRELFEADKSLAKAKQKYDHSVPFKFVE